MNPEMTVLTSLTTPLIGALLIALSGRWPNLRETVTLITAATLFMLVASLYPIVMNGGRPSVVIGEMLPGLSIAFSVEPLGLLFAMIASFLWIINSLYSMGYMDNGLMLLPPSSLILVAIYIWIQKMRNPSLIETH